MPRLGNSISGQHTTISQRGSTANGTVLSPDASVSKLRIVTEGTQFSRRSGRDMPMGMLMPLPGQHVLFFFWLPGSISSSSWKLESVYRRPIYVGSIIETIVIPNQSSFALGRLVHRLITPFPSSICTPHFAQRPRTCHQTIHAMPCLHDDFFFLFWTNRISWMHSVRQFSRWRTSKHLGLLDSRR